MELNVKYCLFSDKLGYGRKYTATLEDAIQMLDSNYTRLFKCFQVESRYTQDGLANQSIEIEL